MKSKITRGSLIAQGGQSAIYNGTITSDGDFEKEVILKEISDDANVDRILKEAKILSKLRHHGICQIISIEEIELKKYLVLEKIDGITLAAFFQKICDRNATVSPNLIFSITKQLVEILSHVTSMNIDGHQFIHDDLSPSNIMIDSNGKIKILDFGVANPVGEARKSFGGNISYSAPEKLENSIASELSDIFSLFVIVAEILLGKRLFNNETQIKSAEEIINFDGKLPLSEIRPDVPNKFLEIVLKNLSPHPKDRNQSFNDLNLELSRLSSLFKPIEIVEMNPFFAAQNSTKTTLLPKKFNIPRRKIIQSGYLTILLTLLGTLISFLIPFIQKSSVRNYQPIKIELLMNGNNSDISPSFSKEESLSENSKILSTSTCLTICRVMQQGVINSSLRKRDSLEKFISDGKVQSFSDFLEKNRLIESYQSKNQNVFHKMCTHVESCGSAQKQMISYRELFQGNNSQTEFLTDINQLSDSILENSISSDSIKNSEPVDLSKVRPIEFKMFQAAIVDVPIKNFPNSQSDCSRVGEMVAAYYLFNLVYSEIDWEKGFNLILVQIPWIYSLVDLKNNYFKFEIESDVKGRSRNACVIRFEEGRIYTRFWQPWGMLNGKK